GSVSYAERFTLDSALNRQDLAQSAELRLSPPRRIRLAVHRTCRIDAIPNADSDCTPRAKTSTRERAQSPGTPVQPRYRGLWLFRYLSSGTSKYISSLPEALRTPVR